ncbi:PAS domain-containing protein [Afifella sp. IM 167]|uniref:PAS domain-containing protein n=1 Tax=Afifella sp. IM 167 TaxID=2033586 RepID=UPI001CCFAA49|nr:PAS domain-containing protein [Afifella sp. IM 167]
MGEASENRPLGSAALAELRRENETLKERLAALEAERATEVADARGPAEILARREEQQRAVAELGNAALAGMRLDELFAVAARRTSHALGCDYCKILELQPDGRGLVLVAGEGWNARLVGKAYVESGDNSQAGFTLVSRKPVVIRDLQEESRFRASQLFADHGVRSGVSVPIGEPERPWGVLGVHACESERFGEEDVGFVQAVANILAVAIERRRVERRLEEQEERLRLSLDSAEIGTWVWNPQTDLVEGDARMFELYGMEEREGPVPQSEFLGRVHPKDRERIAAEAAAMAEHGTPLRAEFRTLRPDGEVRWIAAAAERVFWGRKARAYGVNYDITTARMARQTLADAEERYRLSIRAVTGLVYEQDLATDIVHTNEGFDGLIGAPGPQGADLLEWWTARIHPEDRPAILEIRRELKAGERESFEATFRARHEDGRWIDVWDRGYVTFDRDGEPRRLFGFASDISELIDVQRRQTALLAELDHRVKNMLANISAIAAQSRSGTHTVESYIRTLRGRIDTLAQSHELLSRSGWVGAGLRTLVNRIVEPYSSSAAGKVEIDGPEILLEPRLVQSIGLILHELASNAARHGALASEGGRVEITWSNADGQLDFAWSESGAAPGERRPDGFGMFVIRAMLRTELKGEPQLVFSSDGMSCRFTLPLPQEKPAAKTRSGERRPAASAPELEEAPAAYLPASGRGVLIVEDSPLLSSIMQEAVEAAGWPVVGIAGEVAEARRMVAEETFGVALLDLNLGDEIADAVARDLKEKGVPYLIASAHRPSDFLEADLADAPFLPKPIDQRALVELLRIMMPPAAA